MELAKVFEKRFFLSNCTLNDELRVVWVVRVIRIIRVFRVIRVIKIN